MTGGHGYVVLAATAVIVHDVMVTKAWGHSWPRRFLVVPTSKEISINAGILLGTNQIATKGSIT